jgi:hypothetical protein
MKPIAPTFPTLRQRTQTLLALLALFTAAALLAAGCAQKKAPAASTATPELVTLIDDTEARCDKLGRAGLQKIRDAERDPARGSSSYVSYRDVHQKYLDTEAVPELAMVDRAGELAVELMPKVREESSSDVVQAIESLQSAVEQLCQRARSARPSAANLKENLDYAVQGYKTAQAKLAPLYTVGDADVQYARHKLDPLLEQARAAAPAGVAAGSGKLAPEKYEQQRQEYAAAQDFQTRQEAEHAAAVARWREREEGDKADRQRAKAALDRAPSQGAQGSTPEQLQQSLRTWSASYAAKAAPVKAALADYLTVRQGSAEEIQPVCQTLLAATSALLADRAALDAPEYVAGRALKRAYGSLRNCAQLCSTGYNAQAVIELGDYVKALREADSALRPYGVAP